ncbi:MAG: single-stranded-DNA-specific exonuclease RecJ, partial [Alphaproteobacteria bacterium]
GGFARGSGEPACLGVTCSALGRRWRMRLSDDQAAFALGQALGVPDILARVLAGRGVPVHQAKAYLSPSLRQDLPDPSILADMDVAATRVANAIRSGETIGLFGDYDVDGATSSSLLARFIKSVGGASRIYIPDRMKEGYGPSPAAMRQLASEGIKLVLTLDCGTRSFEALEAARAIGIEVVVIDHHLPGTELPPALALVNPNRLDDRSGLGYICAAGAAFLLAVAVNRALRASGWYSGREEPNLLELLDLVALGTVCDVVPLVGLNRAFVQQGLKVMRGARNTGLAALGEVARVGDKLGAYELGFMFGPRINAGGRLSDSSLGARLLMTEDAQEARRLAIELDRLNRERRAIEAEVEAEAVAQVENAGALSRVLTLMGESWHPGVVGIVAGRLRERFSRPTLVMGLAPDGAHGRVAKGSGRSMRGVDLGRAIVKAEAEGLVLKGGGHAMAVGLTALEKQIEELGAFLDVELGEDVEKARESEALEIDTVLSVSGATRALCETLESAGPYGAGNPSPVVAVSPARIAYVAPAGEKHLRLTLEGPSGGRLRAVAFRSVDTPVGDMISAAGERWLHFAGGLKPDNWASATGVQLVIEDVAFA